MNNYGDEWHSRYEWSKKENDYIMNNLQCTRCGINFKDFADKKILGDDRPSTYNAEDCLFNVTKHVVDGVTTYELHGAFCPMCSRVYEYETGKFNKK